MTESKLWGYLKYALQMADPTSDATRHEDRLSIGTPDVSFCVMRLPGWTELKCLERVPRSGIVVLDNLMPWQVNWIVARGEAGASSSLLLAIGVNGILVPWWNVRGLFRGRSLRRLEAGAVWTGRVNLRSELATIPRGFAQCVRWD